MNKYQKQQSQKILSAYGIDLEKSYENDLDLIKGRKMPIGTISNGYKKVAEGKWQKVSEQHREVLPKLDDKIVFQDKPIPKEVSDRIQANMRAKLDERREEYKNQSLK